MKIGKKTLWVIMVIVVVAVVGILIWSFNRPASEENMVNEADIIHKTSDETGGLPEKVIEKKINGA